MPQSFAAVLIHLTFSTKGREPLLDASVCSRLHAYMATVLRNAGSEFVRTGGVEDHVHLAFDLPRTLAIASVVEELKTTSTKWLKTQSPRLKRLPGNEGMRRFRFGRRILMWYASTSMGKWSITGSIRLRTSFERC